MNASEKQFKDPVHGYISVPDDWCTDFIDTPIFQRLRQIEQTSMRPLYPAAHHDRFIHSLGTYHLGRRLLSCLISNTSDPATKKLLEEGPIRTTFLVACLMHDCGHAPFSHTFEGFYNYTESATSQRAYKLLSEEFPGSDFIVDGSFDPAPHEAFSAVVLNRCYKDALVKYGCDAELAARMITGCTYPDEREPEIQVRNRMISLLNGKAIDVDKLDYILRDTWASGVQNTAVDIARLFASALFYCDNGGTVQFCYAKSALSVLQNVVDARNYLYEWVYNHHTVLYYAKLLDRSIRKLAKHLAKPKDPDAFWKMVFSLEPFRGRVRVANKVYVYLPTDGDMLYLLKLFESAIPLPDVHELLSHESKRVVLWKTYAEFRLFFKGRPVMIPAICTSVAKRLPRLLANEFKCPEEDVLVVSALNKHYVIEESHVQILLDGDIKPFTEVMGDQPQRKPGNFFYVFVPPTLSDKKREIVRIICAQTR